MGPRRSAIYDQIRRSSMDSTHAPPLQNSEHRSRRLHLLLIPVQVTELSTQSIHAEMTLPTCRLFGKSTYASITLSEGVQETEKWFLILVLLKMETRRQDHEDSKPSSASSGRSDANWMAE